MTDKVLEAIETEIGELKDRLDHLRTVREAYRHPATQERVDGAVVADQIVEWLKGYNAEYIFTNSVVAKNLDLASTAAQQGIRRLLDRKILHDASPNKTRHKDYGLTSKGKALLFPQNAPTTEPAEVKTSERMSRKPKVSKPRGKAGFTPTKQAPRGSRQKQVLEFLKANRYFTFQSAAEAIGFPNKNACQVTMGSYNKKANGTLYEPMNIPDRKKTDPLTYRSKLWDGSADSSTPQPTVASSPTREVRIRPGEGVSTGRIR